jgi:glutamate synthase (NADPH/NADH) small chain
MSKYPFLNIDRVRHLYRPVRERLNDFHEVEDKFTREQAVEQSSRCMDCGVPFCHGLGCPLGNLIPDMNRAVHNNDYRLAWELLSSTSPFPEFTSRICPALCEGSCTEGLMLEPVMVRQIEKSVVETAFENGWVLPLKPGKRTGKKVIVIGAGPAGLAAARMLNTAGHTVSVYEKERFAGGLLRYGIPDFKLEKRIVERRIQLMKQEGIEFVCGTVIGADISAEYLRNRCDVLLITCGTPLPRDLKIPGRELENIHFALDFLRGQNRACSTENNKCFISAKGKKVLVIGGGDTGSDCVGTANRQGALSVTQIEIMPKPPEVRSESTPWPDWPYKQRSSSSHEEGCNRFWNIQSKQFIGKDGKVAGVETAQVEWTFSPFGKPLSFKEKETGKKTFEADVVLLAMGFFKQDRAAVLQSFSMNDVPEIFLAGDTANGPSLVVRAIVDGMKTADAINRFLTK